MSIGIDLSYFVPYKLGADQCGENGLPVCPNATRILGRAEVLKSVRCSALQQFVDLEQGQHERLIIAQARYDADQVGKKPQTHRQNKTFSVSNAPPKAPCQTKLQENC